VSIGLLLFSLGAGAWFVVGHSSWPEPPDPVTAPLAPQVDAAARATAETQRSDPHDASERLAATESREHALPEWVAPCRILPGKLTAAEVTKALGYVEPLVEQAIREIEGRPASQLADAESIAADAEALHRAELWQAVGRALLRGDYVVLAEPPTSWRPPQGTLVQTLPSWQQGVPVTLFFTFELATYPALRDTREYQGRAKRFGLSEAARRFNELPDERRRALFDELQQLRRTQPWLEMPNAMQAMFPLENRVDPVSLLMTSPR
jgi:hypothetical protein